MPPITGIIARTIARQRQKIINNYLIKESMKKFLLTIASVLLASMASAQVSVQHQNLDVVVNNPSASQQSQAVKKVAKVANNQRWLGYYNSDNWAGEGQGMGVPSYPGDNQV